MINPNEEQLLSLADAARNLPRRRRGKRPHISTVYRWTTHGCKGVVLDSVQIGGTRCTSHEALARFFSALTAQADVGRRDSAEPSPNRRQAIEKARESLRRAGI